MTEAEIHFILTLCGLAAAIIVFIALFFVSAPYGRHSRKGWGPMVSTTVGWSVMEMPAAVLMAFYFLLGSAPKNLPVVIFFLLWEVHYFPRAFLYPNFTRHGQKKMPVAIIFFGLIFNVGNTYINGRYLFELSGGYPNSWLTDPRFLTGLVLFIAGYALNQWSDRSLRNLRKPGDTAYQIPAGWPFRLISCPNYLGEIIEWTGWAVATWSLPGLVFAIWTFANLAPRARTHHAWYHSHFKEYPPKRKALIPWVW